LIRLLRDRLAENESRDIGNDFGRRVGQKIRFYDRLPGESPDARMAAFVERAAAGQCAGALKVIVEWRIDLEDEIRGLLAVEPVLEGRHPGA
jgi:hypothetical protein